MPKLLFSHQRDAPWVTQGSGASYRNIVSSRVGGAYQSSALHIAAGGPVADDVHYHDVALELIVCHRGWLEVVYEGQGEPIRLSPGDVVLQPPEIRHRMVEASDDLYLVEVSSPIEGRATVDPTMDLPTPTLEPHRRFRRQRFVHHVAATGSWKSENNSPFEAQDSGVSLATAGMASARLLRCSEQWDWPNPVTTDEDFCMLFVLSGAAAFVSFDGAVEGLLPGSAVMIPPGETHALDDIIAGTLLVEITATVKPPQDER